MTKVYRSTPETFSPQTLISEIKALREWSQEQHRGGQRRPGRRTSKEVSRAFKYAELENTHGSGRRAGTAGHVLLATLVDKILDGNSDEDGDWNKISMHFNIETLR